MANVEFINGQAVTKDQDGGSVENQNRMNIVIEEPSKENYDSTVSNDRHRINGSN